MFCVELLSRGSFSDTLSPGHAGPLLKDWPGPQCWQPLAVSPQPLMEVVTQGKWKLPPPWRSQMELPAAAAWF